MAYNRVNWQSGTKVSDGYVEIDGTQHTVVQPVYQGPTPINPAGLNIMDAGIKENSDMLNGNIPIKKIFVEDIACKNLFDKNSIIKNSELNGTNGDIVNNRTGYYVSNFIEVEPNEIYYLTKDDSYGSSNCFYDSNKEFVSTVSLRTGILTVPNNNSIKYFRFNGLMSDIDNVQVEKGNEATDVVLYKGFGIQSGSNSNGEWIKFDDGTMICHKKITLNNVGFIYQQGSLYFCPLQQLGNMPQTFTQLYGVFENLSSGYGFSQGVKSSSNSSFGQIQYFRGEQGNEQTLVIDVMAIGRWK